MNVNAYLYMCVHTSVCLHLCFGVCTFVSNSASTLYLNTNKLCRHLNGIVYYCIGLCVLPWLLDMVELLSLAICIDIK